MNSNAQNNQPLTPEQLRAFDEIFATFATPGWRFLKRELKNMQASVADVRNAQNLDFAKGQLTILDALVNWETLWETLHNGAKDGSIDVAPEFGNDPGL